jgi:hypothetical protein
VIADGDTISSKQLEALQKTIGAAEANAARLASLASQKQKEANAQKHQAEMHWNSLIAARQQFLLKTAQDLNSRHLDAKARLDDATRNAANQKSRIREDVAQEGKGTTQRAYRKNLRSELERAEAIRVQADRDVQDAARELERAKQEINRAVDEFANSFVDTNDNNAASQRISDCATQSNN